ncbi:DUF4398 domain-containing protein [Aquabacterium sp. CECT 9606]|uniref:DUF4398 domain-containing protein n=1 Tax=Aquabacterium sp. CECT 9606 TaxID=2845822 RepID=UPI001E578165|nr:DUF4398 domain-containing protein [Aquabacterium sp. CECT 9606]CAH0351168.1 hypothetical protein AQB9606_01958 [Aquabacterium sp. CECT 9606]
MTKFTLSRRSHAILSLAVLGPCALYLGGCASKPGPKAEMAVANAAVQRASTTGTSEDAAVQLQVATGKLASARQAMASKDFERAKQLAEQAQVDAQVAELHAQSERSRKAAQESQDAARVLRDEINRNTAR